MSGLVTALRSSFVVPGYQKDKGIDQRDFATAPLTALRYRVQLILVFLSGENKGEVVKQNLMTRDVLGPGLGLEAQVKSSTRN